MNLYGKRSYTARPMLGITHMADFISNDPGKTIERHGYSSHEQTARVEAFRQAMSIVCPAPWDGWAKTQNTRMLGDELRIREDAPVSVCWASYPKRRD